MAVAATAIGIVLGAAAGISAAYLRGAPDGIIMRSVDVILSFPQLVFALLLLSLLGPKSWLIVVAVGVSHAPAVARVIRSATLDVAERDYVKVAELQGMRPVKVMAREILPNLISPLMVEAGLRLTYSIVIMAGLAFLGFGQPPPTANWGTMINENRVGLPLNPWAVIAPAVLIALLTIGTNTFTDAVARVAIGVDRSTRRRRPCWTSSARSSRDGRLRRSSRRSARCAGGGGGWTSGDLEVRLGRTRSPMSSARFPSRSRLARCSAWWASPGSGKTTVVARAARPCPPRAAHQRAARSTCDGVDLLRLPAAELRAFRGARVAYVPAGSVRRAQPARCGSGRS